MTTTRTVGADGSPTGRARGIGEAAPPHMARAASWPARRSFGPPILPQEDARAFRRRLKSWAESLGPRNAVEQYLVERAVILSWQLDRADRNELSRIAHLADDARPIPSPAEATPLGLGPDFEDTESGDRLRRYQLACGRTLLRTLRAFAEFRETAGRIDPPAPTGRPDPGSRAILPIADPSSEVVPPADVDEPEPSSPPAEDRTASPSANVPSPRLRPTNPRLRRRGWSSPGAERAASPSDDRRPRPLVRSRRCPEAPTVAPESRRRVGGYEVPLDVSTPVSCADRIPVRLRRLASALDSSRAAVAHPAP